MKQTIIMFAGMFAVVLGLAGCGTGGSSATAPQQKTAVITFSTVSSFHPAPLQGILVTMKLPVGVTIPDIAKAITGHNASAGVTPGVYTSANNTVTFAAHADNTPPADYISFGDFATLTCSVAQGVTLDQSSFTLAPADLQMTGVASGNSFEMAGQIPVRLSVKFGY